jgi:hypothetical protein
MSMFASLPRRIVIWLVLWPRHVRQTSHRLNVFARTRCGNARDDIAVLAEHFNRYARKPARPSDRSASER